MTDTISRIRNAATIIAWDGASRRLLDPRDADAMAPPSSAWVDRPA
jgi:hypothetical protein